MAIKNFIKENTYTILNDILYSKKDRKLSFSIVCYEDDTKKNMLMNNSISLSFDQICEVIDEYYTSSKQLEPDKLSFILSPAEKNGYYTKRVQKRTEADGTVNTVENLEKGVSPTYIYIPTLKQYMKFNKETELYELHSGLETIHFWEENLAPDKMKPYGDILEFAYIFAYRHLPLLKGASRV